MLAYTIAILTKSTEVAAHAAQFALLAAEALEHNVFYEAWFLGSALEKFESSRTRIVVVRRPSGELSGVFPFELQPKFRGLPLSVLRSWQHPHCYLRTPLIAKSDAQATVRALLQWLQSPQAPADIVELEEVSFGGPFEQLFAAELARADGWRSFRMGFERACYFPLENPQPGISHKHAKELRRLERRLGEHGALVYRVLESGEDIGPWIERFLVLEASGWKGQEGTAFASQPGSAYLFKEVFLAAHRLGRAQMLALELDGQPVALKCNLLCPDGAFAFKIAYDEKYAEFSPGVLLELFNMKVAVQERIGWMDSCAIPQHFMINRLWVDRRQLGTFLIAGRGVLPRLLVSQWRNYHALRRLLKQKVGGR